jgi:DNA-binding SARP family transcriptional activator
MSTLAIRCLGPLDIRLGDRPLAGFETQKARGLFVYLACQAGQPLSRAHLESLLWGESTPDHASRSLRQALVNLRHILPADLLRADRETVTFHPPADFFLDVAAFAADLPAAELYRGDFLQGFDVRAAPQWEEWLMAQREAFQARALAALEALAIRHTTRGEYAAAAACWQRSLAIDPWRESAHQGLLRVYLLSDQRSAALAQYQRCRDALQAGLGVAPLPETEALYERIRRGTGEAEADLPLAAALPLPFIGRGEWHAQLMAAWQAAGRGGPRLLLVAGEAGLGKTRLVEEALRQIASYGAIVARGRCLEFGAEIPYRPVIEALRALLAAGFGASQPRSAWQIELSRLLPELSERLVGAVALPLADPTARQRIFDAVMRFLGACASQAHVRAGRGAGLALFFDDLHWADTSTLDLLNHLVHAPRKDAGDLWLIGAYRPEETPLAHPFTRWRLGLAREDLAQRITLAPLTERAVAEIAAWLSADEAQISSLATYLQCQSEGNPFILSEIVRDLQESGVLQPAAGRWRLVGNLQSPCVSERVADVTLGRVARLPGSAQRLLNFAAVIGEPFTTDLLAAIVPDAAPQLAPSVAAWEAAGLVRSDPAGRLEFAHDRIRAAIYGSLASDLQKLFHERVGQALLDRHAPPVPDAIAAQAAYHFERSLAPRRAVPYLAQAAQAAGRVYAHAAAADYYRLSEKDLDFLI